MFLPNCHIYLCAPGCTVVLLIRWNHACFPVLLKLYNSMCVCIFTCITLCVHICLCYSIIDSYNCVCMYLSTFACSSGSVYVTCSHEMIDKSRHAVPRFSLKTVVGVNLGEIEIFALYRNSFIFAPYTCSFLLYSTHKCFKFCK